MLRSVKASALAACTVLAMSSLAACGSSSDDSSSSPSASPSSSSAAPTSSAASPKSSSSATPAATAKITIKDYKYSGPSKVAPGTKITVTNQDTEAHTVTADSGGAFDVPVAPSKSVTFTAPSKAGAYKYHCTYHSNMHGSLTVG